MLETLRAYLRTRDASTYLVGGTVRDLLLGRAIHDVDVAVQGSASKLARAFADEIGALVYVMDESFDVARVIWETNGARAIADFARLRGGSLENDLRTRDFTINAMAAATLTWNGAAETVIDPLHGLADLRARRVRAVSETVFRDDAVRLARAARLAGELDFELDDATRAWLRRDAPLLQTAPMERVRDEWMRIVAGANVLAQLRQLDELDLFGQILPEVNALRGVTQAPPHLYDVFEHSLRAVAAAEEMERARYAFGASAAFQDQLAAHFAQRVGGARTRRELLRFTLLLHDLGKPSTRTVETSGRIHFFGHADAGAALAVAALRRLKFSNEETAWVKTVIENHLRPILLAQNGMSARALYRYFRDLGAVGVDVAAHAWCDQRATYGAALPPEIDAALRMVSGRMFDAYFRAHAQVVAPPALINGEDVMALLDLAPGPRVRDWLEQVREAQALGQISTRAEALAFLKTRRSDDQKL